MKSIDNAPKRVALGLAEFIAMMAFMTSLLALSIDAMLPALPAIGADLGAPAVASTQLIITVLVLGLALGQLFFGPLSDAIGRKPSIMTGLLLFAVGSCLSLLAESMFVMLLGRFLQGFGVSGPRIVGQALIRDQFTGRAMARVMSFIMMVFILVPMLAPAFGALVMWLAHWRMIFAFFIVFSVIVGLWFGWRQPETLTVSRRSKMTVNNLKQSLQFFFRQKASVWFTAASGFVFAGFLTYLSSSQVIFVDIYQTDQLFPLYFAILAGAVGLASVVNSQLVMRLGMRTLSFVAVVGFVMCFLGLWMIAGFYQGVPNLSVFMSGGFIGFFCIGILFGNINALAMQPLGDIAGIGAALVGSLSNVISVFFAVIMGFLQNQTLYPVLAAFVIYGLMTLLCLYQGFQGFQEE